MGGRHWPQVQSRNEHPLGTADRPPGAGSCHPAPAILLSHPSCSAVFHLSKLLASGPDVLGKLSSHGAPWASQGPS